MKIFVRSGVEYLDIITRGRSKWCNGSISNAFLTYLSNYMNVGMSTFTIDTAAGQQLFYTFPSRSGLIDLNEIKLFQILF